MQKSRLSAGRLLLVTLILSALSLTGCGSLSPVVLQGNSLVLELKAGQPAPSDGYLLSPAALVELMECCNDKLSLAE